MIYKVGAWMFCALAIMLQFIGAFSNISIKPLSPEEKEKLKNLKETDETNAWELSGQYEGDIIVRPRSRNGLLNKDRKWPNATIPYMFSSKFTDKEQEKILGYLKIFMDETCIKIRPKLPEEKDFLVIIPNYPGCSSDVGRLGGIQVMNLDQENCINSRNVLHEFLHVIGFYHMHATPRRDTFLEIFFENIDQVYNHNFNLRTENLTEFGLPYDYNSIMHYSGKAFVKAPDLISIKPKMPGIILKTHTRPSPIDIMKVNLMYNCTEKFINIKSKPNKQKDKTKKKGKLVKKS